MNCTRKSARGVWLPSLLLLFGLRGAWAEEPKSKPALEESLSKPAPLLPWGATHKDIPEGYMVIEGDMVVPFGFGRTAAPWTTAWYADFWPGGVMVYEFDTNVAPVNRQRMRDAMAELAAVANVRFVEEGDCGLVHCVHIQDSDINSSMVGRQVFRQPINIHNWDWRFIICHELLHTLGFFHEQSRSDRDTYVRINWEHIQPGEEDNFTREDDSGRYGPYDFDSVMHYGRADFSRDGQDTITVLPPNEEWQTRIGQREHLSHWDQTIMSFIYAYPNWRFVGNYDYDCSQPAGSFLCPYGNFASGASATPNFGTLWIAQPGIYSARGTYNRPMTWQAPLGGVTLN